MTADAQRLPDVHDPLCGWVPPAYFHDGQVAESWCHCDLIAKVRADERKVAIASLDTMTLTADDDGQVSWEWHGDTGITCVSRPVMELLIGEMNEASRFGRAVEDYFNQPVEAAE